MFLHFIWFGILLRCGEPICLSSWSVAVSSPSGASSRFPPIKSFLLYVHTFKFAHAILPISLTDPAKFFGFELGAQTTTDAVNDKYIVNGKHDQEDLAKLLDGFIDKFVLCKTCRNPETAMAIKGGNIELRCKACGAIGAADNVHKLAGFILKNPPSAGKTAGKTAGERASDTAAKAAAEEVPITASDDKMDDGWATDTSAEAVEKRRAELLGNTLAKTLVEGEKPLDAESSDVQSMRKLSEFVNKQPKPSDKEIVQFARKLSLDEGWKDSRTLQAVFGVLFDNPKDIVKQMKARAKTLGAFVRDENDQKLVLFCIERLCQVDAAVIPKVTNLLMILYDVDVVEEDIVMKWFKHPTKKLDEALSTSIRASAKKFIDWLQTAEADD
jgi:translation initiation factor 5